MTRVEAPGTPRPGTPAPGARSALLSGSPRRVWWTAFSAFAIVLILWSLATPLFSLPDEQAHVIKAAAVARGQFLGRDVHTAAGLTETRVRVPGGVVSPIPCFAFRMTVSANCQKLPATSTGLRDASTLAGHYQPLYYAIVGIGSLIAPNHVGVYLMRFISALLGAALLASSLLSVRRWSSGFGPLALACAVTPMTVFLSAGVNPSGLEITAAICTWATLITLLSQPESRDTRMVVRLGVAGCTLMLTRSLSPLWFAVIVALCVLAFGWGALRALLRRRSVQVSSLLLLIAGATASAWIVSAGALTLAPNRERSGIHSFAAALTRSFDRIPWTTSQMVGVFGWLDTSPSMWTYVVWAVVAGSLVLLCLSTARRRHCLVLAAAVGVTLVLPVLIEASQAKTLGLVWQGRYALPAAVGIPLLAGQFADLARWGDLGPLVHRINRVGLWLLMSGQFVAFVWNLRRYTVGLHHGIGLIHVIWHPPLNALLLVVLFAAASVALGSRLLGPREVPAAQVACASKTASTGARGDQ